LSTDSSAHFHEDPLSVFLHKVVNRQTGRQVDKQTERHTNAEGNKMLFYHVYEIVMIQTADYKSCWYKNVVPGGQI